MIKVYIYPFNDNELNDNMFLPDNSDIDPDSRDNVQLLVFKHLREACIKEDIELHTCDYFDPDSKEKTIHIFMRQWPFDHLISSKNVVLGAYHIWESPVLVKNYPEDQFNVLDQIAKAFQKVYTVPTLDSIRSVVPHLAENIPVQKGTLHQPYDGVIDSFWSRTNRKFITLIANYKVSSIKKQDLYSERLRAIGFFSDKGLELYGNYWDQVESYRELSPKAWFYNLRKLRSSVIRGTLHGELLSLVNSKAIRRSWTKRPAPHKHQTLSEYTFCICYESSIFEGFVTEKIFDCLVSGTIPIYLGAPDISKYVTKDCYIDKRDFGSYESLHKYLLSLSQATIDNYRKAAREYFNSVMYKQFTKEAFADLFIRDVKKFALANQ